MAFNNRMNKKNDRAHFANKGDRQHSFGGGHTANSSDREEDHRKEDRRFGGDFARTGGNRESQSNKNFERQNDAPRTDDQRRTQNFENRFARENSPSASGRYTGYTNRNVESNNSAPSQPRRFEERRPSSGGFEQKRFSDSPRYERRDESRPARNDAAPRFDRRQSQSFNRSDDRRNSYSGKPRFERRDDFRPRSSNTFTETNIPGIFEFKGNIYTRNANPGQIVYGEKLFTWDGIEYRQWDPMRSKLGAGLKKGIQEIGMKKDSTVLYLGCSTGTTVSHVSEIVGTNGIVYALDVAPRVMRDMVLLSKKRHNIFPIIADANRPTTFSHAVPQVDVVFMDIAQSNQVEIFLKNVHAFLKSGGICILSLKSRSMDISKSPSQLFAESRALLERDVDVIDYKTLDPFEKDHALFVCKKR